MNLEAQRKIVEEILGTPLPEIDQIYYEGAKIWKDVEVNPFITPYFLSKLYNKDEMKMVIALPGDADEVAKKTGFDVDYCAKTLKNLFINGKILPKVRYHLETADSYMPTINLTTLRDHIGMKYNATKKDWSDQHELFLLAEAWHVSPDYSPEMAAKMKNTSRIIPKWNSIKNIPGVMLCENMHDLIYEHTKQGTFSHQRCICKSFYNYIHTGKAIHEDGGGSPTGIIEHGNEDGHCMWFNQRCDYVVEMWNGYKPKPEETEHLDMLLENMEDAVVVYTAADSRDMAEVCTCGKDSNCPIVNWQIAGLDVYKESRFKPEVSEDKCVGCKLCQSRCIFDAISYDADGKCVVNETKCKGCGNCVVKCPTKALKMKVVHDTDWIPDIINYANIPLEDNK